MQMLTFFLLQRLMARVNLMRISAIGTFPKSKTCTSVSQVQRIKEAVTSRQMTNADSPDAAFQGASRFNADLKSWEVSKTTALVYSKLQELWELLLPKCLH